MVRKKVFVSGCYDLMHAGHIAFFKEASSYGDLYVGLGSDATIGDLKGREPVNSEQERLFMVKAIRYVKDAWINTDSGFLDFETDIRNFRPDIFIVNEDGNSQAKIAICAELDIDYIVLNRVPEPGLPTRSTSAIRNSNTCMLPYRLDLAGTWIDQPYVSKYGAGWAITMSLEPIIEYNERSGMATSTRNVARKFWPHQLPSGHPEKLAQMLFHCENGPGKEQISGAQDSIGICMPGLNRHFYEGKYWPTQIESCHDERVLSWLEEHLYMVTLWPRKPGLDLLGTARIDEEGVRLLTQAADSCWDAILTRDLGAFARHYLASFNAQTRMFPAMLTPEIQEAIDQHSDQALGWKLSGAGGAGYLVFVADEPIKGAMKLKIRRKSSF
ncbi:MAG: adenylyltransferase/cytidyltransferase family protein [Phycisphaerales bacterium]|nr:adenylyltransferase/cytidyltransferase family protein [Phycisphaerales bacterium]